MAGTFIVVLWVTCGLMAPLQLIAIHYHRRQMSPLQTRLYDFSRAGSWIMSGTLYAGFVADWLASKLPGRFASLADLMSFQGVSLFMLGALATPLLSACALGLARYPFGGRRADT
ncbi:hypothetical protein [Halomonas sp. I5-271120]|uniref:hypothetical protein n=1 Tax=Halomonas sp. I5-271120 TaxID=3061632 RepID=UPI0027149B12|nr:hypothetical protein [Halomonas sp. I5-271120]